MNPLQRIAAVIVPATLMFSVLCVFVSALWPIAAAQTEAANQSVKSGTLESARRSRKSPSA